MTVVSMNVASLALALLSSIPVALAAQQEAPVTPAAPSAPPGFEIPKDMKPYYVALYVRGPKFMDADTPERTALTRRHLEYVRRMIESHTYLFAGPLLDGGNTQGIAIVAAPNADAARRVTESDPAIAAGHMAIELHPAMLPSLASLVVKY